VAAAGSQLVLAADSAAMARHAATQGWITSEAASAVHLDDGGPSGTSLPTPQEQSQARPPAAALETVRPEGLHSVLKEASGADSRNVVVDAAASNPDRSGPRTT
jgi:hypothetical protein